MMNKLIKNKKDYENALSRIDCIFDAKPGTKEYDELELLTALVEIYEEKHFPINLPDPIEAIKFRMEQQGLIQKDMIPYFGSKSKVSEILNGKRPLTLTMMRALNIKLGIPAEVLLREKEGEFPTTNSELDWSKFPIVEMVKRGWISSNRNLKEDAEELMRGLINKVGGFETIPAGFFRQGIRGRYNPKMDNYSLMAWYFRVLSLAQDNLLKSKYKGSIGLENLRQIAHLSYFEDGVLLAKEYLEKQGIHLIITKHLPRTYLDGAAILLSDGTPIIALTLRHDRIDNFWFCLMHELSHLSLHLSSSERFIIDDLDLRQNDITLDRIEDEADRLAEEALIPSKVWKKKSIKDENMIDKMYSLAEELKINPAIIAGRIRHEKNNYRILSKHIGRNEIRKYFFTSKN